MLVGGEGSDTLTITATNAGVSAATTVTGIETINVNSSGLFAATYDAAGVTGTGATINVSNAVTSGSFAVTNLGSGATIGATGVSGALSVTTAAAATQTLTLAANTAASQAVVLTGTTGTADTATVAAAGTVALTTNNTQQIETVNLSGNGAAATYNITGAATTYNVTGSQNVTVAGNVTSFDGKTLTDNTTAGTTKLSITTAATSDLSKIAADVISLDAVSAAATYTLKNGQALDVTAIPTGDITLDINDQTTTNVNGSVTVSTDVVFSTGSGIALDATASTDNITTLNIVNDQVAQTALEVLAGTAADVVITGNKAVTLEAASTAKSVNASALTAALTVNYTAATPKIATVTGGSGNDVFTNATAATTTNATINGGAGNDTLTAVTGAKFTFDGGEGSGDKVVLAGTNDATNLVLSNVEIISLTGTGAASFKASQLTGKSYVVTGDATADKIIVGGATNTIDSTTIDLSSLVLDTTNVTSTEITLNDATTTTTVYQTAAYGLGTAFAITGTAVQDTVIVSGFSGTNTISTGAGNDVIVGGTGVDTITGGEGADTITGGAGNDTIILTETTAVVDTVVLSASNNGVDTITGFTAGTSGDVVRLVAANTAVTETGTTAVLINHTVTGLTSTGAYDMSGANFGGTGVALSTSSVLELVLTTTQQGYGDLSAATDGSELFKLLGNGTAVANALTTASAQKGYIMAYDNGNAYLYSYDAGAADTSVTASEIALVGVFNTITADAFVAGNFTAV